MSIPPDSHTNQSEPSRLHAFDALRAAMMLLGIVLHAALGYVTFDAEEWAFRDKAVSRLADLLVIGIHTFRMPVFFAMAGFFAALLLERRGLAGMFRNRLSRVTVPFLAFWVVLQPLTVASVVIATRLQIKAGVDVAELISADLPYWSNNTAHLWFLWYLTLFYVAIIVSAPVRNRVPNAHVETMSRLFLQMMASPYRAAVCALPLAVLLVWGRGTLPTSTSFTPHPVDVVGHVIFFAFGWALWHHREALAHLSRTSTRELVYSVALFPFFVVALARAQIPGELPAVVAASVLGAVITWLGVFGFVGSAFRVAAREHAWVRYFTDASYWMYLVHVPLMFVIHGILSRLALPAAVKMGLSIVIATPLLVLSYHWLVRGTYIGVMLNGRRFPVRFPPTAGFPAQSSTGTDARTV